jgi:hypothetical protein
MTTAPIPPTLKITLVLLWLTFPLLWYRANQLTAFSDAAGSLVFLIGMVVFYGILVGGWIVHNIRIWKKKGARRNLRVVPFVASHDVLKRPILNTVPLLEGKNIHVAVVDNRKVFSDGSIPHPPGVKAG